MALRMNRREFLATSTLAVAGCACRLEGGAQSPAPFKHSLPKAVIVGQPTEEVLKPIKEAGFQGVEAGIVSPEEATAARKVAADLGLRIHSVLRGWARFNSRQSEEVEESFETTVKALQAAQGYGAEAILLVPGRIDVKPLPDPWKFRVKFDRETGHLTAVAGRENDRYQAYMDAHNRASDAFQEALHRLLPSAEQTGVVMAIENVWNNLFVDPSHFAHFIDSFQSPWVKAYLDLGNPVQYSRTERWVALLGARIAKCHVKDFKLNPNRRGGRFVALREGSVDWPTVRQALDDVGYRGWMTIEGSGGLSLAERSRRLDLIFAGK